MVQYFCSSYHFILFFIPFMGYTVNSINWPASSVWVFIAQLVEHCSMNAEATGLNSFEALKNLFFRLFCNCFKNCDSIAMVTSSFHVISCKFRFLKQFLHDRVVDPVKSLPPFSSWTSVWCY